MLHGLTFEILHIILRNFHGYWREYYVPNKLCSSLASANPANKTFVQRRSAQRL